MGSEQLLYDLKVYNDATGEMLGYVKSLSDDGLEMVCDRAIDLEKESFFALENILDMEPGHLALFAATCERCDLDDDIIDLYHVKLTFTQLSSAASELTQVLH